MGLIKRQLLKVIQWEDSTQNTIVQKFEYDDRYAIMKGSELIVRPSQAAIFVYRGSVCDVFTEGNWKLDEGSTPVLTAIANWKYAFENPKQIDVYFVNLRRFTQMKWGTPNPVMMRDKDFGMIRIAGHGEYSFHVSNPEKFMKEVFGTIHSYKTEDIQEHLKSIVLSELTANVKFQRSNLRRIISNSAKPLASTQNRDSTNSVLTSIPSSSAISNFPKRWNKRWTNAPRSVFSTARWAIMHNTNPCRQCATRQMRKMRRKRESRCEILPPMRSKSRCCGNRKMWQMRSGRPRRFKVLSRMRSASKRNLPQVQSKRESGYEILPRMRSED